MPPTIAPSSIVVSAARESAATSVSNTLETPRESDARRAHFNPSRPATIDPPDTDEIQQLRQIARSLSRHSADVENMARYPPPVGTTHVLLAGIAHRRESRVDDIDQLRSA
jgi:hypothetical protein